MNVTFTGRNLEITPDLKKYTEKKLKKLEKILGSILHAEVVFSTEKYQQTVEINIKSKNSILNAREVSKDIYIALNAVFDQLDRRAKKAKDKLKERKKRVSKAITPPFPQSSRENIVRRNSFSPKPMSLSEAVEYMEISKQDIFVFSDINSGNFHVLHKRKNGTYDLIEIK